MRVCTWSTWSTWNERAHQILNHWEHRLEYLSKALGFDTLARNSHTHTVAHKRTYEYLYQAMQE